MQRCVFPWVLAGALCAAPPAQSEPAPAASARCEHPPCAWSSPLPLRRDAAAQDPAGGSGWYAWAVLAGVALAGAWLVRRRGASPWPAGRQPAAAARATLARVASQSLAPQVAVHVVRWRGEEWLLGCTPQSVTVLARGPVAMADGGAGSCPPDPGPPRSGPPHSGPPSSEPPGSEPPRCAPPPAPEAAP